MLVERLEVLNVVSLGVSLLFVVGMYRQLLGPSVILTTCNLVSQEILVVDLQL